MGPQILYNAAAQRQQVHRQQAPVQMTSKVSQIYWKHSILYAVSRMGLLVLLLSLILARFAQALQVLLPSFPHQHAVHRLRSALHLCLVRNYMPFCMTWLTHCTDLHGSRPSIFRLSSPAISHLVFMTPQPSRILQTTPSSRSQIISPTRLGRIAVRLSGGRFSRSH
jgi:hypothetical protein